MTNADAHHVLLVEDDHDISFLTATQLSVAGHDVSTAASMHEALGILDDESAPVDVIILDLGLPDIEGLNGLSVLDGDVPVIVYTGDGRGTVRTQSAAMGAAGFLLKGAVSAEDLDAAVRNAVAGARRRAPESGGVAPYDDVADAVEGCLRMMAATTPFSGWAYLTQEGGVHAVRCVAGETGCIRPGAIVSVLALPNGARAEAPAGGSSILRVGGRAFAPASSILQACTIADRPHGVLIGWSDDDVALGDDAFGLVAHAARMIVTLHRTLEDGVRATKRADIAGQAATIDALTGLGNRRAYDSELRAEDAQCERFGHASTVFMIDLDRLKEINDTAGHAAGDRYLRDAAAALQLGVRGGDAVFRVGGDEFAVIATRCGSDSAGLLAQRLRELLEARDVHASIGYASRPESPNLFEAAQEADAAMYAEKQERRAARVRS